MRIHFLVFLVALLASCSSAPAKSGHSAGTKYFQAIRRQIEPSWRSELKAHRAEIPKWGDLSTGVLIRVAADGSVKKVEITSPSASKVLDILAVQTLVKSSPWPAPPITMLKGGYASLKWELSAGHHKD